MPGPGPGRAPKAQEMASPAGLLSVLRQSLKRSAPGAATAVPILSDVSRRYVDRKMAEEDATRTAPRRRAAVLVPLCYTGGAPSILFTKRTDHVSTHKGQVSFPGGHIEDGETEVACALRETEEELGAGMGDVEVLGFCETVPAVTGTLVTPVVGFVGRDTEEIRWALSEDEVEAVFTLPLEGLMDGSLLEMREDRAVRAKLPVFHGGPHEVWGLTAMILHGFIENCLRDALPGAGLGWGHEGGPVAGDEDRARR